jgi:hypothetical protein
VIFSKFRPFLLRRLVEATGGLYYMPLEEEKRPALARFGEAVTSELFGVPSAGVRFEDWDAALRSALQALARPSGGPGIPTLVIDELPYLLAHSPEIPSVLQRLYDESRQDPSAAPIRVIICGSALSVMTDLLSGSKALRGRAVLDMGLGPFSYRQAAEFWGLSRPDLSLAVHAVFGGTPGYRDLVAGGPALNADDMGTWLARTVLNPAHALYSESDYLLREDPRLTDRALYHSILTSIAAGRSTPTQIGAEIGRPATALAYPLGVLQTAGFVQRVEDVLLQRRPTLLLTDPIVRFHQLITAPRVADLEEGRALEVWQSAGDTFSANILGPHFESLARQWVRSFGAQEGLHERPGAIGPTVVNDSAQRSQHEVDVVALAQGQAAQSRDPRITLLGEAKYSLKPRTIADVERLEHIKDLFIRRGVEAKRAQLAIFCRVKPERSLQKLAAQRQDVLLVDIAALYGKS